VLKKDVPVFCLCMLGANTREEEKQLS